MKFIIFIFLTIFNIYTFAASDILTCYDELDRKSTIIEYDLSKTEAVIKESGDEFKCEPDMAIYCTTTVGMLEVSSSQLIFTWTRELSGTESIYRVNRKDLNYLGEFSGALWHGQCESN